LTRENDCGDDSLHFDSLTETGRISSLMPFRFEFDAANKILLMRFKGRLTKESALELYQAIRTHSTATDASAGIWDFSSMTEVALSAEFLRRMVDLEPAMPDGAKRPRVVIPPPTAGLSILRILEVAAQVTRPRFKVVRNMEEALAALGVQPPHFQPLQ
jgi:hypothetical protein